MVLWLHENHTPVFASSIFPAHLYAVPPPRRPVQYPRGSGVYVFQRKIETQFKELHGLQLDGCLDPPPGVGGLSIYPGGGPRHLSQR
jgi:hypothetical protein